MKTNTEQQIEGIRAINERGTVPQGILALRQWLRQNGYDKELGFESRSMQTSLIEQKHVVEGIRSSRTDETALIVLLTWLVDHGYESSTECEHELIVRKTGLCYSCGVDPNQEAIDKAREKGLFSTALEQSIKARHGFDERI